MSAETDSKRRPLRGVRLVKTGDEWTLVGMEKAEELSRMSPVVVISALQGTAEDSDSYDGS